MTKNPQYPTPKPTLAAITVSVNGFALKVQAALDGGKIAIAARKAARVELLSLMRQLAAYVQGNCNANLTAPLNPRLALTRKRGELLFKFERVKNSVNYTIQIADSANGPWRDYDRSTATRVVIDGLTPGQTYSANFSPDTNSSRASSRTATRRVLARTVPPARANGARRPRRWPSKAKQRTP